LAAAFVCALALPAAAQPKRGKKEAPAAPAPLEQKVDKVPAKAETPPKKVKEQNFNFDGLGLNGRSRSPQLLYFLERANEELERASLEKRSFVPNMVKTVEDEAL
jgi:hypothetical protein